MRRSTPGRPLGVDAVATLLPGPDPSGGHAGFDNGSDSLTVQGTDVLAFQTAAESLAATAVTNNLRTLIGGCDTTQPAQVCVRSAFLDNFATKRIAAL